MGRGGWEEGAQPSNQVQETLMELDVHILARIWGP